MFRTALILVLLTIALPASVFAAAQGNAPATQPAVMKIPGTTVQFTMVKLPGGTVDVAIPKQDPKNVNVKPFWIGLTEVTWDEYDVFALGFDFPNPEAKIAEVGKTRPTPPYGDPGYGHRASGYPAMSVAPQSAQAYCKWLSTKLNKKFRLPTEAEWEYAARAGLPAEATANIENHKKFLDPIAWYEDNSLNAAGDPEVHPVAQKLANAWGLCDTRGNVAEWTVADDASLVARGGSFKDAAAKVHCRARILFNPKILQARDPQIPQSVWWLSDGPHVGFRLAMED